MTNPAHFTPSSSCQYPSPTKVAILPVEFRSLSLPDPGALAQIFVHSPDLLHGAVLRFLGATDGFPRGQSSEGTPRRQWIFPHPRREALLSHGPAEVYVDPTRDVSV